MTTDQGTEPSATASRNAEVTFWTYVDVRGDDECWPWTGTRLAWGYGKWRGTTAHRVAYRYASGESLTRWEFVLQGRDRLVNPHVGSGNGYAKLTETQVVEMRRLAAEGVSRRDLAIRFHVAYPTVHHVIARKRWTHV